MKLIRIAKGKKEVVETGNRKKLLARMKQLKSSTRKGVCGWGGVYKVEYKIEENNYDETK